MSVHFTPTMYKWLLSKEVTLADLQVEDPDLFR